METKFLKFVTDDDVIAQVEEQETSYKLKNPAKLIITHEGIGLGPLNPFVTSKEIEVKKEHVVYVGEPETEFKNAYNSQFGSGIVTAPASALNIVGVD